MKNFLKYTLFAGVVLGIYILIDFFIKKSKEEKQDSEATGTGSTPVGTVVGQPVSETEQAIEQGVVIPEAGPKAMTQQQTFYCEKTGESLKTADYQAYINFVSKCQQAGGRVNQTWNAGTIGELTRKKLGIIGDDADISDYAYMQLR